MLFIQFPYCEHTIHKTIDDKSKTLPILAELAEKKTLYNQLIIHNSSAIHLAFFSDFFGFIEKLFYSALRNY